MVIKRGIQTFKIEAFYRINKGFLIKIAGMQGWQFPENFIISEKIKKHAMELSQGIHRLEEHR